MVQAPTGEGRLIVLGVVMGAVFWIFEAILHVLVFDDSGLLEQIVRPEVHEAWMRITVLAMFVGFALYSRGMLRARRRAEETAKRASAELIQIFETAADGMRVVDRDFNVLRANETFAALAGLDKADIVGRKCHEVFRGHLCDTPGCPLVRILDHAERVEYDAEKERRDGVRVPCIVTATPYRGPDGEVLGIVEDFKDISERRQSERELMASRERLRKLASHLQVVREEERRRIALELHDELGQALTALNMDVHWLNRKLGPADAALRDKAAGMSRLIGDTVGSVRRICSELRPGLLDDFGLSAAIEWQAEEFGKRTGIACGISSVPPEIKLNEELSIAIFRIFQETLTNVARHAGASRVEVRLRQSEGGFEMRVRDNGGGIDLRQARSPTSFGLIGMRERARDLGGDFHISGDAGGTTVLVSVPRAAGERVPA